jgi:hypothetical protein
MAPALKAAMGASKAWQLDVTMEQQYGQRIEINTKETPV